MTQSQLFLNILPAVSRDSSGLCVALLGGGGKTALLFQLGKEFANENNRVLMTSITKAGPSNNFPVTLTDPQGKISLTHLFKYQNPVYLLHEKIRADKYTGISTAQLKALIPKADVTLFECDGSRNLPLKAHNPGDPVVPDFATHVIITVGADVINTKVNDGKVHRPELFRSLWDMQNNPVIDIDLITQVLTHKKGYPSKIPDSVEKIYFVNKADIFPKEAEALALSISRVTPDVVFWGSIHKSWWKTVA